MSVFVGLDCGGSSSRVLAIDSLGAVVFQGQSGAANLATTPEARLRKNLQNATNGCPNADYVCGCFAGLVSNETGARGTVLLRQLFPGASVRAEADYTAALYASEPETDLCVVSGTGSLVCSRDHGVIHKSGGRGYILGDQGSGYQFGRDALNAYLDHPETASPTLREAVRELFGAEDEGSIVAMVYRTGTPASILAKLAKVLGTDARAGIPYATESVTRNICALAEIVVQHVEKFIEGRKILNISLAGGVWKGPSVFRDEFDSVIQTMLEGRTVRTSRINKAPLHGAVEIAREMSTIS